MNRNRRTTWTFLVVLCALLSSCEGPLGPEGPQGASGPQGRTGDPGPGTRLVFSGTLNSSGAVVVVLPAAAGTLNDPPVISCYISDSGSTWLIIATDVGANIACGFSASGGAISVVIVGAPPLWLYRIVVVY